MSGRIRQHVNPLKSEFLRIPHARMELPAGVPVEVELGSGEAHFLMDRARQEPGAIYLGVEIRRDMVARANGECGRAGLSQVRSVFANMSLDLPKLFPPGSVRRFHLNFPDPWFKSRQHKRRVVNEALIGDLHRALAAGGEVHVATDIFDIALDAMAELENETPRRFVNVLAPWTFMKQSSFEARSRRERQCEAENTKIWRIVYGKVK